MKKLVVLVLAAATAMVLAVGSGSAVAASGSARACADAGGTYTKSGSDSICVFPEENVVTLPTTATLRRHSRPLPGKAIWATTQKPCARALRASAELVVVHSTAV